MSAERDIVQEVANAMQKAREDIGASVEQRIAFAYAEAAMRSVLEPRLREALAQSPEDAEWLRDFANGAPGPSRESRDRLEAIANRLSGVRE